MLGKPFTDTKKEKKKEPLMTDATEDLFDFQTNLQDKNIQHLFENNYCSYHYRHTTLSSL